MFALFNRRSFSSLISSYWCTTVEGMSAGEVSVDGQDLQAAARVTARMDLVRLARENGLALSPETAITPEGISRLLDNVAPVELRLLSEDDRLFIASKKKLGKPAQTIIEVMLRSAALRLTKPPQGTRNPMYPDGTYREHYPHYVRLLALLPKALDRPPGVDMGRLEQHVREHVELTGNVTSNPRPKMVNVHPFTY